MPAFLVHGVPDTHVVWDEVCAHLSRTDVVRPDLPGFAAPLPDGFIPDKESYVAWLIGELEAVGEPVDLVGHDWGSLLVVRAATTRPDLIRTLAFGGGPIDETYVWHDVAQLWQQPEIGEQVMEAMTPEAMAVALPGMGLTTAQAARTAANITPAMKAAILALYRSAVTVGAEWGPALDAPFDRPSLALWGGDDVYAPPEYGDRMADRLGGDSIIFDACGHWWPASRPEAVAAALEELWGRGA